VPSVFKPPPPPEIVRERHLGPLVVRLGQVEGGPAVVTLVNKTSRSISGISVTATLAKRAQPLAFGGAASCRAGRVRLTCKLDAIPPRHKLALRVSFRGPRRTHGRLTVRFGSLRRGLPLRLSR